MRADAIQEASRVLRETGFLKQSHIDSMAKSPYWYTYLACSR